jgi:hypothetical protein
MSLLLNSLVTWIAVVNSENFFDDDDESLGLIIKGSFLVNVLVDWLEECRVIGWVRKRGGCLGWPVWVGEWIGCCWCMDVRQLRMYAIGHLASDKWLAFTHSRSWALLEKLPIVEPLKNFPAFYGTQRFITMFTRALHRSLSLATSVQSIPSYLSKIHFNMAEASWEFS